MLSKIKHMTRHTNFSIKQLRVFTHVAHSGSLTEAAEQLFLSKSAVSLSLSELEKQLGHSLFDRVNHRLLLNSQGYQLLPYADELLQRHSAIEDLFAEQGEISGKLKIGTSHTVGNHLLPFMIAKFNPNPLSGTKQDYIDRTIRISNNDRLCQQLLDYEIDLGLTEGDVTHPDLISLPFAHDEMCIICPNDHPLVSEAKIGIEQLDKSKWLLREPGSGSRNFFLTHIAPFIPNWQQSYQFNTSTAIINAVSAGLGLSCLSCLSILSNNAQGRVVKLGLDVPMRRQYSLVIHKDKYRSPLLNAFIEFARNWK